MPSTTLQLRRGTSSEMASFTGVLGEIAVDTTKNVLVVHDNGTQGGWEMLRADFAKTIETIQET